MGRSASMKTPQATGLFVLVTVASWGCGAAWDYAKNGVNWGSLGQCGAAVQQSPIDLPPSAASIKDTKLFLKYPKVGHSFQLYNNGYSIALTLPEQYKGGFGLSETLDALKTEDGNAYRLWQVNFHSPSEHTIDGKQQPLEMQMMHQRVTGGGPETAVVVVLFQDAANTYIDFLEKLLMDTKGLPQKAWEEKTVLAGLDFSHVVGGSPFYHYEGSLTVPPCESKVKYYVRQEPIATAHHQLREFQKVLLATCGPQGNFRAVRPLTLDGGGVKLMASVDVVKSPDVTVKPKNHKVDKPHSALTHDQAEQQAGCDSYEFDEMFKHRQRIRVAESKDWTAAKERFNSFNRKAQAAEAAEGGARRALEMNKGIYEAAPGYVEKITSKWGLDTAQTVYSGASTNLGDIGKQAQKEKNIFYKAIAAECHRKHKEAERLRQEELAKHPEVIPEAPPPTPALPKVEYPAPNVKLPRGLGASPFAEKGEGKSAPKKAVEGDSDTEASVARLAPNLHQPDLPPSSSVAKANGKDFGLKKAKKSEDIVLHLDLPISPANMPVDKETFKKDLADALAWSGGVVPARMKVDKIEAHNITKVHTSGLLAVASQMPVKFLGSRFNT